MTLKALAGPGRGTLYRGGQHSCRWLLICLCTWLPLVSLGCIEESWHVKFGWKAEEYFEDPQVIALCEAVEANDIDAIDRIVQAGAKVNTVGKDGMTPLMWAYPGDNLGRFQRLLELGADPNVLVTARLGEKTGIRPGDSVMSMCAKTTFKGYLEAALKHGGNPNIKDSWGNFPLGNVIKSGGDKKARIKLLIEAGADLDQIGFGDVTPVMYAASWGRQFDLALYLLELGADPRVRRKKDLQNFLEFICFYETMHGGWSTQEQEEFEPLEQWLNKHGYDVSKARGDAQRWWEDMKRHPSEPLKSSLRYRELSERVAAEKEAAAAQTPE